MGNPKDYPVYWDKILINASGYKPVNRPLKSLWVKVSWAKARKIERDENEESLRLAPDRAFNAIMFSAMSYGSISYNAHAGSQAKSSESLQHGEGGLHEDFTNTATIR